MAGRGRIHIDLLGRGRTNSGIPPAARIDLDRRAVIDPRRGSEINVEAFRRRDALAGGVGRIHDPDAAAVGIGCSQRLRRAACGYGRRPIDEGSGNP